VLNVNCNGCVKALQFLNVDEKLITFGHASNKFNGYELNDWHPLNVPLNTDASGFDENKPDGIEVIDVNEKLSVNVCAIGDDWNISAGIVVIPVPRIKLANVIISFNPSYPISIEDEAGIVIILLQPKKSSVLKPTLPKSIIPVIRLLIAELLFTFHPGIKPVIVIV
jgi:hypothetical protein